MKKFSFLLMPVMAWLLFLQLGAGMLHCHHAEESPKHFCDTPYMGQVVETSDNETCIACLYTKIKTSWYFSLNVAQVLLATIVFTVLIIYKSDATFAPVFQAAGRAPPVVPFSR